MYLNQRIKFLERVVRMMDENRSKGNRGVFGPFRNIIGSFIGSFTLLRRTDSPCCIREHRYWYPLSGATGNWWLTGILQRLAIVMIALILASC